jgi:GT2 family glycosyltransferase
MTAPSVWAILLTHGGAEEITAACIESLLESDYPALRVLLVDNASPDGSGERLRDRYPIAYLNTGGNLGFTGGNNQGIAFALDHGADYLLVINNDTVVDRACVSTLVRVAQTERAVGVVAPKIMYYDLPDRVWYAGGDFSYRKAIGVHRGELSEDDPAEAFRVDEMTFATGCCMLIPGPAIRAVGAFDDRFFIYCEDAELSLRMTRAGYRLLYVPTARMLHREPPGPADPSPFQIRLRDRNRRRIAEMHFTAAQRATFYAFFLASRIVRMTQYLLRGQRDRAVAIAQGALADQVAPTRTAAASP